MFVLVRHAEAGKKKRWSGRDDERPLTPTGLQQAEGVDRNLVMLHAPTLITSPYLRCRQTLEPLARRTGRSIGVEAWLRPGAKPAELDVLLTDAAFEGAVLCTHAETIEAVLRRWDRRSTVSIPLRRSAIDKNATAKGGAWVVTDDGEGWAAHYLKPLHVGPALADEG